MRVLLVSSFSKDSQVGISSVTTGLVAVLKNPCAVDSLDVATTEVFSSYVGTGLLKIPRITLGNLKKLFFYLKDYSPTVIHAHDHGILPILSYAYGLLMSIPIVSTLHISPSRPGDFDVSEFFSYFDRFIKQNFLNSLFFRLLLRKSDAIIALNPTTVTQLTQMGLKNKTHHIPNARNLSLYNKCTVTRSTEPAKNLIFVGHLTKRKNQEYLIGVMKHLPENYHLYLIGEAFNSTYLKHLEQSAEGLNVHFTGKIPHEEVPNYLEKSHLFVSASLLEVQSLAVIEALASGTPVVGLANATLDELVDASVGARLPENTKEEDFAAEIMRICSLPQNEYQKLSESSRAQVAHLDWKCVLPQVTALYQKVIEEKRPTPVLKRYCFGGLFLALAVILANCLIIMYGCECTIRWLHGKIAGIKTAI